MSTIANRYAKALFELADDANKLEPIDAQLEQFVELWEDNQNLRNVFHDPTFSANQRREVLTKVLLKAEADDLLRNTLWLLSDRQRMAVVPQLLSAYRQLAETKLGRVEAEIVTATRLPDAYYEQLRSTLESVTGKKIVVRRREDPSLIAGVVARVGDQVFDGSAKAQLDELKDKLLDAT